MLVGTGFVGMSFAYALLNQNACDELILIDIDKARLRRGNGFKPRSGFFGFAHEYPHRGSTPTAQTPILWQSAPGSPKSRANRGLICCSGTPEVFRSIIGPVMSSGFGGIFLIATNPVDIMTHVTQKISGVDPKRVIGTGTTLDTARLRYMLGNYFSVDPRNIHAYVMGEHGDKASLCRGRRRWSAPNRFCSLRGDGREVLRHGYAKNQRGCKNAAQKIIEAKKSDLLRYRDGDGQDCPRDFRHNENSILTVSARLDGEYGQKDVYAGVPCIVNRNGVREIVELKLTDEELLQDARLLRDVEERGNEGLEN